MEDMDLDLEEMEEGEEIERQNRTFVLLVAVMGGLLLIGIIAFCAWVFIVGRGMLGQQAAVVPTNTPSQVAAAGQTATAEAEEELSADMTPASEVSPSPTSTPTPTSPPPTPSPTRSPTPRPTERRTSTPASAAGVTPTIGPRRTHTPAAATPAAATSPETGLGTFTALILAAGLLVLLFVARRLRTAY